MDAIFRRSYGRIPGIAILFVLAVFSFLFISSPASGVDARSQHYRRDVGALVWRQEPSESTSISTPTGTSTFGTPSSNSTTITSTTQTSSSTSSVPTTTTITTTSTSTRSVTSTSTGASNSTTSISTTVSTSSTTSTSPSAVTPLTSTVTRTRARVTTSEPVPETTLIAGDNFLPTFTTTQTSTQSEPSSTGTPQAVGATSKGFWANKAAIAAVFVIVSLVVLGLGALLIVNFLKRRNTARQRLLHTRLFEKYSDAPSPTGSAHQRPDVVYDDSRFTGAKVTSEYPFAGTGSSVVGSSSAGAATAPAPQQQQYQYQAPPSSSHGSQQTAFYTPNASQQSLSTHEQHNFAAFSTNPAPPTSAATAQRTHYMLPSQAQAAAFSHYNTTTSRLAPPVAYRDPTQADRASYQHSIDSFYGGANQR